MLKSPLSARPVIEALEARIAPATFTVTTTADSGPGSLRQAILDANALEGADTVGFDIPGDQLQVISVLSPLPAITDKVTISNGAEKVRIDGTSAGSDATGLTITTPAANGSSVVGLQITNFSASGILIDGSSGVAIGGNQVFGNSLHGLHVKAGDSNTIYGNTFGAATSISGAAGNEGNGILIENSTGNVIGAPVHDFNRLPGNVIQGNGLFGIEVRGSISTTLTGNTISGNGNLAAEIDQGGGIAVINSATTFIGENAEYVYQSYPMLVYWNIKGNSISENKGNGILIKGQASTGTKISGNTITGNLLGDGVRIDGAVSTTFADTEGNPTIRGHYERLVGNTISQNAGWGIAAVNGASNTIVRASTIEGNSIGAILLDNAVSSVIGGQKVYYNDTGNPYTTTETSRDGNKIQFNFGSSGVIVKDSSGIEISSNSFIGSGPWIDLGGDGATPNDVGDADVGPNHLQNYPILFDSTEQLTGTLSTDAVNTKFRIQVFTWNPATNELALFQTQEVTTGANGTASLVINKGSTSTGQKFFATATNINTGETSEVSLPAAIKPKVSIAGASTTEGDFGTTNLSFTLTLDAATILPVKVSYRSTDGTAKAGEDYGAIDSFVVFEPGETTKTVVIPVFGDPIEEARESFFVDLTSVENGFFGNSRATGTIINDDGIPTISIQDVLTAEGSNPSSTRPGYSEVQYTLILSKKSLDPVSVNLSAAGGTATYNDDYDFVSASISFAPGTTSATGIFYIKNDTAREEIETIQLQLSNPTEGTLGNANAVVSIVDDDTWQIQAEAVQIEEGNSGQSVAVMKVRLVNSYGVTDHTHPITVDFTTQNGTAAAGSDYTSTSGTLTFQPGEIEKTVSVPILGDSTAEQNESFAVKFSKPFGATLQQASQTVTILNDDPGTVSVAPVSITEGHSGKNMLVFNVSMSGPTTSPVSVSFESQDGTALAGIDFEAVAGQLTFAPGETQKTISVPILGDRISEQNEAFTIKLTGSSGATIATATATGTILNDDPLINIESAQFLEGQPTTPGSHTVYLPVRLSQATDIPVSVDFATSNGSAEAPSDYIATSGTLTFAAGQTIQYIELQIVGDLTFEPDETFSVKLSNPRGAQLGTDTGVVTIEPDEPFISAQDVTIMEGQTGIKSLVFTVTLSQVQSSAVTVDYATADDTANAGSDYTAVSGTVTFAPGETTKTVSVPIQGDTLQEPDETFRLLLSNASGAGLATAEVHGVIADDEIGITISDSSQLEGTIPYIDPRSSSQRIYFTVSLSHASELPISVKWETLDGTATWNSNYSTSDYEAANGTLFFSPGETSKTISVWVNPDSAYEGNETFTVQLSDPQNAQLDRAAAVGTIQNDDRLVASLTPGSVLEGNEGKTLLPFTVSLIGKPLGPVSVEFYTFDTGTARAGVDFETTRVTIVFSPTHTSETVYVPVLGDYLVEGSETVRAFLSSSDAQTPTWPVEGIIQDDDSNVTLPEIRISNRSIQEGNTGTTSLVFTFNLSKASTSPVSVQYATADGTASAGSDYTSTSGTLTFAPGETTKTVSVPILGDQQVEADETLRLLLSNASGANLATAEVQGTIANDDSPQSLPVLSVANASVGEGHIGTSSLVFTFTLSKASASPVSVQYGTTNGTATAGSDYTAASGTLTFAPGETTKTVSVSISGDRQVEANETLRLLLSGVTGATLSTTEATGFILDDDSATPNLPTLSVQGGSVYEGYTGIKPLIFTVTLSEVPAWPVSLQYVTSGYTAYSGSDYLDALGSLTFAPGETTKTIEIPVFGDEYREENETVRLYISSPIGATISTSQATGTILNDDLYGEDVGLMISKVGKGKYKAVWSENDGDLVTLISSQQISWLSFGYDAEGHTVVQKVSTVGDKPSNLQFSVQKSLTGDGKVNVDQIWTNADLTSVTIPGRLGSIIAGDTKLKTPGIRKLTVDSFGLDPAAADAGAEPLQSKIRGSIGSFTVEGDFTGANLSVTGGSFGSLTIGGDLQGTSSATATGLYVEKGLNKLHVDGDIRGTDSAHPVVIRTAGFPDRPTETLHRVVIGGDVVNTNLLAGTTSQVGIRVGDILVNGNWTASNLIVGAGAGPDELFGTDDDMAMQNSVSRIARITIRGAISGTSEAESGTDHFGFVAGRIAAFQVGAQKLDLSSKWKDSMEVGSTFDVMLRELAGRSRA